MGQKQVPLKILDVIHSFINEHLETKKKELAGIAALRCGFEKWMQLEFVIWAMGEYELNPRHDRDDDTDGIGLEHTTVINKLPRHWKTVDVWLHARGEGTYYIEMKSMVEGWNMEKQISSWVEDFRILNNIRKDYYPHGVASILFGSQGDSDRWTKESWKEFVNERIKTSGLQPSCEVIGSIGIAILCK